MKTDERAELVEREVLSPDAQLLHFRSEDLYARFRPGQFTMVRIPDEPSVLLRRPYSFCDVRHDEGWFSLLVKDVGAGTRALVRLPLGSNVDCLGPLGSWFRLPAEDRTPVIVAGGVGIAPFVAWCRELVGRKRRAIVLLGGRTARDLYLRETFQALGMDVRCTTEDGSFGRKGLVTELVADVLEEEDRMELYSCGPSAMLLKVAELARSRDVPHQVSLERRMGCGMGCCLGCVVFAQPAGESRGEYVRCCTEGPVFDAGKISWDHDPYPL